MEENRDTEQIRLRFFADAFVLSTLCKPSSLESLSSVLAANRTHGQWWETHFLRGYKLVAETALYGLLDRIIRHPSLLEMEEDSRLSHWWAFIQGDDGTSLNAAISDESSRLGQVASRVDHIMTRLRKSVRPWQRFQGAAKEAGEFADLLCEVGHACAVASFDGNEGTPDTQALLKASAIERLDDFCVEHGELGIAYHYVHRESIRNVQPQWGAGLGSLEEAETSRDHVPRPFLTTQMPDDLGVGVLAAVVISLREFGFSIELPELADDVSPESRTGTEALTSAREALERAGARRCPSMSFGLKPAQEIPVETIRALGGQPVAMRPEDRLRVLLSGSTQLVGSRDHFDVRRFEVLVEGIASLLPEDCPIDVLRVVHSDHPGGIESVSIGVSMPVPSVALEDRSAWWVFYGVYMLDKFEPANRAAHEAIEAILRKLKGRIRLEEISEVLTKDLVDLIDESALREENRQLREQVQALKTLNDKLRGAIPEMLSGLLLARTGYRYVRTSHKVRYPGVGERELDAVGVRSSDSGAECLIVEAKGHYDSQHDLMKQVQRLEEKVQLARSNRQVVSQSLEIGEPITSFKGRFVAMADLGDVLSYREEDVEEDAEEEFSPLGLTRHVAEVKELLDGVADIEVWDYGRFKSELQQAGMPEEYIKLVERSVMTWHVGFLD